MVNSDLCDHSRGLSVRFFPFRERIPIIANRPGRLGIAKISSGKTRDEILEGVLQFPVIGDQGIGGAVML
jgi:hypothetical protein